MTREEAIYRLENMTWIRSSDDDRREDIQEALDMAIEALSDMPIHFGYCKDCMSYNGDGEKCKWGLLTGERGYCQHFGERTDEPKLTTAEQVTRKLESAEIPTVADEKSTMSQLKSKLDLISRADAIEAVCNAQCELDVPHYPQCDQVKYCDEIKALLTLPSADAVYIHNDGTLEVKVPNAYKVGRVLVMDTDSHIGGGLFYPDDTVYGEWQKVEEQPYFRKHYDTVCCSVCRKKGNRKWSFCPNCGARMEADHE